MIGRELAQKFAGQYKVLKKIGRLAYRLEVPDHLRIHNVFSIAHLEPDPYNLPRSDHPSSVFVEGDTKESKSYEVERLLDNEVRRRRGKEKMRYLACWKGYGAEWDRWYKTDELSNARDLINDYEKSRGQELPGEAPRKKRGRPRKVRASSFTMAGSEANFVATKVGLAKTSAVVDFISHLKLISPHLSQPFQLSHHRQRAPQVDAHNHSLKTDNFEPPEAPEGPRQV